MTFYTDTDDGGSGDGRGTLVAAAVALSVLIHAGLMAALRDCAFAPPPGVAHSDRRWTKDLPVMQMDTLPGDPLARDTTAEGRPAAAPDEERPEDRVARLEDAAPRTAVPDAPAAADTAAPAADTAPDPLPVAAAEWTPRQDILEITAPTVPDEDAALPRLAVPKTPRAAAAHDIAPPAELLAAPSPAVPDAAPLPVADALAAAAPPPAPLPPGGLGGTGADNPFGFGAPPPSLVPPPAPEDDRPAPPKDPAPAVADTTPPPPAPPPAARVDEKKVVQEKEAVRALRDEQTPAGEPFAGNVRTDLGFWIDPVHPQFKYFRIRLTSRADNPLPVVSKDIVFLLDASGSIANDRLKDCRKAISDSLRQLNSGDRFNIIAFRDKFSYAFPDVAWADVSEDTLKRANQWLSRLVSHGQTDVFRTLQGVLAMPRDPARPVVAFVITDGEATRGMTRNAEIISRFGELNGGLVSVYMYGVKDTANAYLMDMLTRGSRGAWARHESKWRWGAADGIPALSKRFARPVLSDVSVLFSASSRAETYPRLVTNLCEDEPIEIYGICPADQKEVMFRVRGLNGAAVFENLFRLPFASAAPLDATLKKEWATRRLYALIAAYTVDPKPETMRDMRIFAKHYDIDIPYEKEVGAR